MNFYGSNTEKKGDPNCVSENWDCPSRVECGEYLNNCMNWDWKNKMFLSQQPTARDEHDLLARYTANMIRSSSNAYTGMNNPSSLTPKISQYPVGVFNTSNLLSVSTLKASSTFPDYPSLAVRAANTGAIRTPTLDQHNLVGIFGIDDKVHHREADFCPSDCPASIGLNLGVRTYFSTQDTVDGRLVRRPRIYPTGAQVPRCQAEGCKVDLRTAKQYHRRHKVCEQHSKAGSVIACGQTQRFCQQCSRFHVLSEFDDGKRSCRKRLAEHNRRRRKPQTTSISTGIQTAESLVIKKDDPDQSGNTCSGGLQPSTSATNDPSPNTQGLLSPISFSPSVTLTLNMKRQVPSLPVREQTSVYQYLQAGQTQTGRSLPLSTDEAVNLLQNPPQDNVNQNYNQMGLLRSWGRSDTRSNSDSNEIGRQLDFPGHLFSNNNFQTSHACGRNRSRGDELPSCIQNIAVHPARGISNSDWAMGREHYPSFSMNIPGSLGEHHPLSLLETPATGGDSIQNYTRQQAELEFLQQPRGNSNCTNDYLSGHGQQSNVQFSEFQNVREFETSPLY